MRLVLDPMPELAGIDVRVNDPVVVADRAGWEAARLGEVDLREEGATAEGWPLTIVVSRTPDSWLMHAFYDVLDEVVEVVVTATDPEAFAAAGETVGDWLRAARVSFRDLGVAGVADWLD